jgi:SDR family mycofactocin-dependent oxidoreductase
VGGLEGKVAIISGGARGQGRSHAVTLAAAGADIAVCDISRQVATTHYRTATAGELAETQRLVEEQGRRCVAVDADVRDREAMDSFVWRAHRELGSIDIVIANAGINSYAKAWELSGEQWDELLAINLTGVWNTVRPCLPIMIETGKGGSIVLTSSSAGLMPIPNMAHYVAAKHGVTGLAKALAVELAEFGIRCNSVHPGAVDTMQVRNQVNFDLFAGHEGGTFEEVEPALLSLNLLPTAVLQPDEISQGILYLVSDAARAVTGTALRIDAGTTICPPGAWR